MQPQADRIIQFYPLLAHPFKEGQEKMPFVSLDCIIESKMRLS